MIWIEEKYRRAEVVRQQKFIRVYLCLAMDCSGPILDAVHDANPALLYVDGDQNREAVLDELNAKICTFIEEFTKGRGWRKVAQREYFCEWEYSNGIFLHTKRVHFPPTIGVVMSTANAENVAERMTVLNHYWFTISSNVLCFGVNLLMKNNTADAFIEKELIGAIQRCEREQRVGDIGNLLF